MDLVAAVVADEQSLEVMQPGEGALDHPTDAAEPGAVLCLPAGDLGADAAAAELAAVLVVVIAAVGEQPLGALAGPPRPAGHRSDSIEQRQQLRDVVAVPAGQADRQRDSARVGDQMVL